MHHIFVAGAIRQGGYCSGFDPYVPHGKNKKKSHKIKQFMFFNMFKT
jgi:hypothetical protein